jgi:hypothetical protein
MVLPVRIQLSRAPGFRLQEHSRALNGLPAAKVDRTTRFGNPYRVGGLIDLRVVARWGWTFEKCRRRALTRANASCGLKVTFDRPARVSASAASCAA